MGLQARPIIERLSPEQRWGSLVFGLSVLAVVIVVRIAWIVVYRAIGATIRRWRPGFADRLASRDPRGAIVLGWSGMRGLITLATAFALPQQFPGRDLIILKVADLVGWLTDISKPSDGNRATRKGIDRDHLAKAPA